MQPPPDLVARLMCYGIRASSSARADLENSGAVERGFIHGAVVMLGSTRNIVNTSIIDDSYSDDPRAASLTVDDKGRFWIHDQSRKYYAQFLEVPPFATELVEQVPIHDYVRLHSPSTLFATPVRQCAYIAAGRPCLFCTFEPGRVRRLSPQGFEYTLQEYKRWKPHIASLAIGGGSPNMTDFGTRYYAELATRARMLGIQNTSIEIVPARDDLTWIAFAHHSAVDAIITSIEIWDDQRRSELCLGKSEISKSTYLRRWNQAIEILGPGMVSSVLLVGLEALDSTLRGAERMVNEGVVPTLIPYRPYDSSPLGPQQPVDHEDYLMLSRAVAGMLHAARLQPESQPGCTSCGGCSLELILNREYENE